MELLFLCSPTNVSTLGLALTQVLGMHRDIMSPSMQTYILEAGKQANYIRCYREVHATAKRKDAGEAGLGQVAVFTGSEWAWLTRSDSRSGLKKVRQQALGRCCSQNKGYMVIQGLMWLEESLVASMATPGTHMSCFPLQVAGEVLSKGGPSSNSYCRRLPH